MTEDIRNSLRLRGFAFIPGHCPEMSTVEVASKFGELLLLAGFSKVQNLMPREKEVATPNTYSGNYGRGSFPLHSDLAHWPVPPKYLALRSINGMAGVSTRLLDSNDAVAAIGKRMLERTLVQPRRLLASRRPLLRLLDVSGEGGFRFRWDHLFIAPATRQSALVFDKLRYFVDSAKPIEVVLSEPGDTLVINNWRMLHGRAPVGAGAECRRIERVYFDELQ